MDTTNLDDLLNQAEAQEAEQGEWTEDINYITKNFYVDEHGVVEIKNKTIGDMSKHISIKGESYSQYIEFKIGRFFDGIDLTKMQLAIYFNIPNVGEDESRPINVYYNENEIKFGWVIPPEVAQVNLTIDLCIYARGILSDGKNYLLKTKTAEYTINDGLELGSGIIKPTNNWYTNFVFEMDSKVQIATDAANSALNIYNAAKETETIVLQSKQIVEEKSEVVDTQYKEILIMHKEAEEYRDEALQYRNEAEQFSPDGYSDLVEQVNKNTIKVDTIIEKADLGIKETVSGEDIHVNDSANAKVREFALFGKAKQQTTSGKQLLDGNGMSEKIMNGITFTPVENENGLLLYVNVNGTATENAYMVLDNTRVHAKNSEYIGSGCPVGGSDSTYFMQFNYSDADGSIKGVRDIGNGVNYTDMSDAFVNREVYIYVKKGAPVSNLKFYPMIRLASITDDTYEPYTNGASPNPDFPQEIEVSGESYNLLENTATSQTINGVEFVVNEDKSITANGTASANAVIEIHIEKSFAEDVIISGCPKNGSASTYAITVKVDGAWGNFDRENGFTIPKGTVINQINVAVYSGYTANNLTFIPMIRKASVKNNRYMHYGKGSVMVKSCGKNLLKYPYRYTTRSENGIDFTDIGDGTISVNGTATADALFLLKSRDNNYQFEDGNYIVSGTPGSVGKIEISINKTVDGKSTILAQDKGNGANFTISAEDAPHSVFIVVYKGATVNNLVFKPMIRRCDENSNPIGNATYEPYKETTATIPTENGLAGIPVDSGGNYTDSDGQQWICDEIVKYADGGGEKVQRVGKVDLATVTKWGRQSTWLNQSAFNTATILSDAVEVSGYKTLANLMSNRFQIKTPQEIANGEFGIGQGGGVDRTVYVAVEGVTTSEDLISYFANNESIVYYALAEPIRTPLTAEEIAEIENLQTFYPVTNISNDFDCGMKVEYIVDTKNYIDNKLAQIAAAVVNNI